VLGWKGDSNLKADRGSIVHKVLEILAMAKQAQQNNVKVITDDHVGKLSVNKLNLDKIIDKTFGHYTNLVTHHNWSEEDLKICRELVYSAIGLNKGMFNPLHRKIVAPELHFDFHIDKEWAAYTYNLLDGTKLSGHLALKGTIDLVTEIEGGIYEIIDWKTGRRLNWATGEEKTHDKLQDDPQLRLYHYAASHMFPEVEQIIITIFFIADGGPFSICYSQDDLPKTEEMIRKKFDKIKQVRIPHLNKSWKCTKICPYGKTTFADTHIKPIQEFRGGQVTPRGKFMTKCEQIKFEIERKGMQRVDSEYTAKGHALDFYKAPGT
jgi:hypothetical protein